MPEPTTGRAALFGLGSVGGGWVLGLLAYDQLISLMLDRDWLVQTESLTPSPFAPWLVAAGVLVGVALVVVDVRAGTQLATSVGLSRLLVAVGLGMTGLGLFHAHAVGQLFVPGPDAVWLKDLLYHAPGIALIVAGRTVRPVEPSAPEPVGTPVA